MVLCHIQYYIQFGLETSLTRITKNLSRRKNKKVDLEGKKIKQDFKDKKGKGDQKKKNKSKVKVSNKDNGESK